MFEGLAVPEGGFQAIMADPPWFFRPYKEQPEWDKAGSRSVSKHYATMTGPQIEAMPISEIAARDSHLFLWATGPCLPQAIRTMEAWGYRYSGMGFVWIKLRRAFDPRQMRVLPMVERDLFMGLGHTTRKNAEFCLLGRRGNCRRLARDVHEVILSPVRQHSRKPDEAFNRVQRYCAGPYVELFSREQRDGWSTWGNEIGKFSAT